MWWVRGEFMRNKHAEKFNFQCIVEYNYFKFLLIKVTPCGLIWIIINKNATVAMTILFPLNFLHIKFELNNMIICLATCLVYCINA